MPDVAAGQLYGYRVDGPFAPEIGLRFDRAKLLLDPYGKGIARPAARRRQAARDPGDNAASTWKSVVVDTSAYDWEDDAPPRRPFTRTVIYEMHVRGFTQHPSSGLAADKRGTFAGVIDKIPYLKDLGVTAVELLPVFAVRRAGRARGRAQRLGLPAGVLLRPPPGLQLAAGSARSRSTSSATW